MAYQEEGDYSSEEDAPAKLNWNMQTGLPAITEKEAKSAKSKTGGMVFALMLVPRLIGTGIAALIYFFGNKDLYDKRMIVLSSMGNSTFSQVDPSETFSFNLGYLYIAVAFLCVTVHWLNLFPMVYKAAVMPGDAGNLRSNMMIYKVNAIPQSGLAPLPYVVMEEDGAIGEYNRANRALQHFAENGIGLALCIVASGIVFAFPVMILVIVYGLARILYQFRYAEGGYGMTGHAPWFMVHSVLVAPIFEMLTWLVGLKLCLA